MSAASRLALGTVQFGLDYGVSNQVGRPGRDGVRAILEIAEQAGIDILDTAHGYGESERVLGEAEAGRRFRIVTKLPPRRSLPAGGEYAGAAGDAFAASLEKLGTERVHAVLAHLAEDLLGEGGEALWEVLAGIKASGRAARVGASAYSPEETRALLARYPLDIVQVPLSLFDQRLVRSGVLAELRAAGVEVHTRSVFLQGLLLMDPAALPPGFEPARPHIEGLRRRLSAHGLAPLEGALAFALETVGVDRVLVGVNSARELSEIVAAARTPWPPGLDGAGFAVETEAIITPFRWPPGGKPAASFTYQSG